MSEVQRSILDLYTDYETVIGVEVHVQLNTQSKMFCRCANEPNKQPNTNICSICLGYPGTLPLLNKVAVNYAIMAGLATNCAISKKSEFSRKHYFYPDLPKGYQTTQHEVPITQEGYIEIVDQEGKKKKIRLIRIHMEEDAGKNIHALDSYESFVDLNRAGTPLLEIVSYPDMSSSHEVKQYLKALRLIVQYLGICTGNMEEGAFRADTNISVRKKGDPKLGTRCELKNINSFKFISDAIEYEIERQIQILEEGGKVIQETRLWDTKAHCTRTMRSKEEAADYKYLLDPDLPQIIIDDDWIERVKSSLPELPFQKLERLQKQYRLNEYEAEILVNDPILANYYEQAALHSSSQNLINWVLRDLVALLKEQKTPPNEVLITPEKLAYIVDLLDNGKINNHAAKELFEHIAKEGGAPDLLVKQLGLEQVESTEELVAVIEQILAQFNDKVEQYRSGKDKLFGFFVGQIMQKTQGRGNPQLIQEILKKKLSAK